MTGSRRLTIEQRSRLVLLIKPYAGDQLTITAIMGDSEATAFAADIMEAMQKAGLTVEGVNHSVYSGPVLSK